MALPAYTKKMLVERIRRHVANGWPNNNFSISEREVLLHIDAAIASRIVGHAYENAKIEGVLTVPEAYIITYALTVPSYDSDKGEYSTALPQPPLSLPLGHSVTNIFFGGAKGRSQPVSMIKAKRVSYREFMPMPNGVRAWIEGSLLKMATSNGQPLNPGINTIYVTMPSARTTDITEPMNLPDDDISFIFDYTVKELLQRLGAPKDVIQDDLTAGNKNG